VVLSLLCSACTNNPYRPGESGENTFFWVIITEPTKLDPATSYYSHEGEILDQIVEPPFSYHYLKRPFEVIPLLAESVPEPQYFDADGARIPGGDPPADEVARAEYLIDLKPGTYYQDHPCFARDEQGAFLYRDLSFEDIADYSYPSQFPQQATREAVARDFALQIRRLADPRLICPIYSTVERYVEGFAELSAAYRVLLDGERDRRRAEAGPAYNQEQDEKDNPIRLDYFAPEFPGVEVLSDYQFKLVLKRKYPQIRYWLCMHFFSPTPQEALDFYNQPAMVRKQFNLNRCPVGTGPYYLHEYRPNEWIELRKNPNYHEDLYPSEGMPEDEAAGLLVDAGRQLPFIDRVVFVMEQEAIPQWNKFLQGYYDRSAIAVDVFDQAIDLQAGADVEVSPAMQARGIRLQTAVESWFAYMMFNQKDEYGIVSGLEEKDCRLRQAVSIVLDFQEYKDIFMNGRGIVAHSPLPPGIFGYREGREGLNPYVFNWNESQGRAERKSLEEARALIAEAGYPDGRGADGRPLTLYYDHANTTTAFRSIFEWYREKYALLGIRLKERQTDLSRMRQKLDQGNWQLGTSGWIADYPDPENFLFLFYSKNGKVDYQGSNSINYSNPEFDRVFIELESMEDGPARQVLIDRAVDLLQRDAPAVWQYFPETYVLLHDWYRNFKPHLMSKNTLKYHRVDGARRAARQAEWNRPVFWPIGLLLLLLTGSLLPGAVRIYRRERGL